MKTLFDANFEGFESEVRNLIDDVAIDGDESLADAGLYASSANSIDARGDP